MTHMATTSPGPDTAMALKVLCPPTELARRCKPGLSLPLRVMRRCRVSVRCDESRQSQVLRQQHSVSAPRRDAHQRQWQWQLTGTAARHNEGERRVEKGSRQCGGARKGAAATHVRAASDKAKEPWPGQSQHKRLRGDAADSDGRV